MKATLPALNFQVLLTGSKYSESSFKREKTGGPKRKLRKPVVSTVPSLSSLAPLRARPKFRLLVAHVPVTGL